MASPGGGVSSGASDMDQRKRKRMESNRESARRSRMKKQQHLDELARQVGELMKENEEIMKKLSITNQLYGNMEAQNAVLRTQMAELTNRLDSLNEIISFINSSTNNHNYPLMDDEFNYNNNDPEMISDCGFYNPWINQPIMASGNNNIMY
ncbi:hypothetical protein QN277_007710 [Acacia crassicarpa]|uniref:BZIP domain-containing protein n=1 Tax=Acacia crassicarpa TaxID=499986 RepID=A0AAE1IXL1_9FABA|nr:hypothetical protein QN277_007710 [Acacia crassicarpa]